MIAVVAAGVALLIFFAFFALYSGRRIGTLLALDPFYLAACGVALVDVSARWPIAAAIVGIAFGLLPVLFLTAMIVDCRWGVFASDVFYLGFFGIFGQLPLAVGTASLVVIDRLGAAAS